jgi:predicted nuclease of predicted toxin-antitoxin system
MALFLSDECFSGAILRALNTAGFNVVRAADICPAADDETVLAHCFENGRVLLTEDTGFGELCVRLRLPSHGVVVVTVKSLAADKQGARVVEALTELGARVLGSFVTIEPTRTRVRILDEA